MSYNPEEELKGFHCSFTLIPASKVTLERYKHLENNLREDLLKSDCLKDETIRNKNLLAWVMFCLGQREESFKLSQEILQDTHGNNITALGNFVYISFRLGYKVKSEDHMKELRALSDQVNFETLMTEALAEQAYALSRLGGLKNPIKSKELYKTCIEKFPKNYLWKYGLGLVCRRLTKMDLSISSVGNTGLPELTTECVKLLFEVAEHANNDYLEGLAYSQLVPIRQYNGHHEHDALFKGYTVPQLCNKALRFGRNNPVVLTQCGKSLKTWNIDDAIDLLEASLELRKDNTAYSHLGLCFQRKAVMIANGTYRRPRQSFLTIPLDHGCDTKRHREFQNETPKRGASMQSQYRNKSSSRRKDQNTYCPGNIQIFIYNERRMLAKDDELVREAIRCFIMAKKISYGENISATLCLGKIYFITGQFEDALAQFNQVIDRNDDTALVSLIDAYKGAGKCLKKLSDNSENRKLLGEEAKECFAKVISLAVDLVAKNPNYKDFDKLISDSINIFLEDTAPEINQERDISQDDSEVHERFANEEMNIAAQEPDTMDTVLKKLNGYLESGHFEKALAYLTFKSAEPFFVNETTTAEMCDMRSKIYHGAAWLRIKKLSPYCKRAFQKLFEMKYGHCKKIVNKMEEGDMNKYDVLIIDDSETDQGNGLCKTLSRNMLLILNIVFGLETFHHLELTNDHGHDSEELNAECMLKFTLVLLIVDGPISEKYKRVFKTLNQLNGPKILVINCGVIRECPDSLEGGTFVDLNASSGPLTKLLTTTMEEDEFGSKRYEQSKPFLKQIVEKLFDGSPDAVLRLFCLLVGDDFDERRRHWPMDSKDIATPDLSV